jgi:hypothetical protein
VTNLPLFSLLLQLPVLVNIRAVRPRLSRTIQGPKSQPESCFGRMCLSPEKRGYRPCEVLELDLFGFPTHQALELAQCLIRSQSCLARNRRFHCGV